MHPYFLIPMKGTLCSKLLFCLNGSTRKGIGSIRAVLSGGHWGHSREFWDSTSCQFQLRHWESLSLTNQRYQLMQGTQPRGAWYSNSVLSHLWRSASAPNMTIADIFPPSKCGETESCRLNCQRLTSNPPCSLFSAPSYITHTWTLTVWSL